MNMLLLAFTPIIAIGCGVIYFLINAFYLSHKRWQVLYDAHEMFDRRYPALWSIPMDYHAAHNYANIFGGRVIRGTNHRNDRNWTSTEIQK